MAVLSIAFASQEALAQLAVVNSIGGFPVEEALILDEDGRIIARTDSMGSFGITSNKARKVYVWHTAFLPLEAEIAAGGSDTLRLVPYVNSPETKGSMGANTEYIKLRGWFRSFQFNDSRLNFLTDG